MHKLQEIYKLEVTISKPKEHGDRSKQKAQYIEVASTTS